MSVQELVEGYLDVMGTQRRHFFEMLVHFASNQLHKDKLKDLCSREGSEELMWYSWREKRTAFQVLQDFSSVSFPIDYLLDVVPRIKARAFSISSALSAHPNQLHLTMAVVAYKSPLGRARRGVCSTWLASLIPPTPFRVPLWVRQGTVRMPPAHVPLVMIGPGTGCAMFKAFSEERAALLK